jgi:hypothetical protein
LFIDNKYLIKAREVDENSSILKVHSQREIEKETKEACGHDKTEKW